MKTIDEILNDTGEPVEVTVEIDSAHRVNGALRTWYFSTTNRSTGAGENPANTEFLPYLIPGGVLGPLSQSLSEDLLFAGLAANNPGTVTIIQPLPDDDQLSEMHDYVFAGYPIRIKIGLESDVYEDFARYRTTTVKIDPSIELVTAGIQATFQLSSALGRLLEETLIVKKYLGIPHCLRTSTTTGKVTITKQSGHDVSRFTLGIRFRCFSTPTGNRRIWSKSAVPAGSDDHWFINIQATTGLLRVTSSSSGVADIVYLSANNVCDGEWHSLIFARDNDVAAYVIFDSGVETTYTPTGTVNLSNVNLIIGENLAGAFPSDFVDARLMDRYMLPEEARGYFSVRSEGGDLNCIGLWRMDDNSGATVNDYSSLNADGAISGVVNTDYSWQPSDLGEPELAGRPCPLNVGIVINAKADLIDANRERYRGNTDERGWYVPDIGVDGMSLAVRSQGTLLTGGGVDYTTPSDGGDGVFSMTSQEAEPVTYSLLNNGMAEERTYPVPVAKELLTVRTRFTALDLGNVEPMTLLCPWPSGYWTNQETTAQAALQEILGNSGMCYYEEPKGTLFFDMLLPPMGYGPFGDPCLDFRGGQANRVEWGDLADITSSCTVACWVKFNILDQTAYNWGLSEPNQGTLFMVQKGGLSGNYVLYFQSTGPDAGKLKFRIAGTTLAAPAGVIKGPEWYFVAGVFNDSANTMRICAAKQGDTLVEVVSGANSGSPSTNSLDIMVGDSGARYPFMSVQHAQVWSGVKTLGELQSLMDTPPVGNESGLLFYAPLTGDLVDVVSDTTGEIGTATLEAFVGPKYYGNEPQWAPKLLVDLDETPSVKLTEFHHTHPASDITVKYAKNRYPMSNSDIDTGVSQNSRLELTREGKSVPLENAAIRSRFKSAKRVIMDTSIIDSESALRLLRAISTRLSTDRYVGTLTFPSGLNISRLACGLAIGDEIGLTGSIPSQIQTPRSFRVVAVAPNPLKLSTSIVIFG